MNKKKSQNIHAKKRAWERYNYKLNRSDRKEIIRKIQNNEAVHVRKISNRLSIFIIDNKYKVVYDKERKNIATFLEMEME